MYMYIHIYACIDMVKSGNSSLVMLVSASVYIYIYMYTYLYI